ncbi:hypothetical protein ACHAW5_003354 [Stephanodiscus triporus]|uniref:Large ribosomal subunit protein mL59 domain-containing protein n=1 Tax=Stephanodiscus triporus TaxID=2934178 RepID=A0ABD3MYT5_9STRA
MRSALRQLCRHGVEALRPQKVNDKWRGPAISRRVAADLRKSALRSGTYGSFDAATGVGWDPAWDAPDRRGGGCGTTAVDVVVDANVAGVAAAAGGGGSNAGSIQSIRPPRGHKRDRTREARARKIEDLVAKADDRIEEYRLEREKNRPLPGIEEEFKRAVKGSSW